MDRLLTATVATPTVLVASAAVATVAAWAWLGTASPHLPHHTEASLASYLSAVVMWQAMTVAMMTPSVTPWVIAYVRLIGPPAVRPALSFASGYFAIWLVYSAAAAGLQVALGSRALLASTAVSGPLAGLLLVAAGVYQFLPARRACLTHCRNPLTWFLARWRDGPVSGFRLGVSHGAYCVGCCWLLMLTGLALGVMNLAWMAGLTLVVCLEQLAPGGERLGRAAGLGMAAWGLALLLPT